jgi:hypothetical protein
MTQAAKILSGAAVLGALTVACGGGGSGSPTTPGAGTPTPPPVAVTPHPAPTPTPDPRIGLAPGPVARYTIKVRTVNNGERDAEQDGQGRFVVHPNERVDFDSTQKNAGGDICQWTNSPEWTINRQSCPMESTCANGKVLRRGSSQPFLLKTTIQQTGTFTVEASIDGVVSNTLEMNSTPN